MILDYEPGDKVINPKNKDWGIGQVQSIIKNKITDSSDLRSFNAEGYKFSKSESTETEPVFLRK